MEFPEPTRREARALILGLGNFWGFLAMACTLGIAQPKHSAVPVCIAFTSIFWFYFRGVYHVAARAENVSVRRFTIRPISSINGPVGWMSIMSPTYLRRSAEVLEWNVRRTFRIIFAFAAVAIVLFWVLAILAVVH